MYLLGSEVVGVVSEGDEEGAPWRRTAVGESTGEEGASEDGNAQGGRRRRHREAADRERVGRRRRRWGWDFKGELPSSARLYLGKAQRQQKIPYPSWGTWHLLVLFWVRI